MKKDMNLIFDLQLFVDSEIYVASSSKETIKVTNTGATAQKSTGEPKDLQPKVDGAPFAGLDAGSGADSISVGADTTGKTIYGGRGNDTINLTTASSTHGNVYQYVYGDGKDVILGWKNNDTIYLPGIGVSDGLYYKTSMAADGESLIMYLGPGSITFQDLDYGTQIKVIDMYTHAKPEGEERIADTVTFRKLMQGTTSSESIKNAGEDSKSVKSGTAADDAWSIDGNSGNDTITNKGSYVYIEGGYGADKITVSANNGTITSGVTISGGFGNDTIDVSADTITGADFKVADTNSGGHVYKYDAAAGHGKDTIIGFNSNDSILIENLDVEYTTAQSDVDTLGNYVIRFASGSITIKKPEGQELGGTTLNVFNGSISAANRVALGTPVDGAGKQVTGSATPDHYIIPKKLLYSGSSAESVVANTYAGYTVDAAGGNDTVKVEAAGTSIAGGAGNDLISIGAAASNVKDDGSFDPTKTVTIIGGYGIDTIDVSADKKSVNSNDVYSSHIYQFGIYDGKDTIIGFNENDSIQITVPSGGALPAITGNFDSTGKNYVLNVGGATLTLKDYGGGKKIKLINQANEDITSLVSGTFAPASVDSNNNDSFDVGTDYHIIPKYLRGTSGNDNAASGDNVSLKNEGTDGDDFVIQGLAGNDAIINKGASNVYIDGGSGNDTIALEKYTTASPAATVYGADVTIDAGAGDDVIIGESVGTDNKADTVAADEIGTRQILFGAGDGNDTIYYFNENNEIHLKAITYFIGSSVGGTGDKDIILNFSNNANAIRPTSTILLKGYVDDDRENEIVLVEAGKQTTTKFNIPKLVEGTTGNDPSLENNKPEYEIKAYAGNDTISNSVNGSGVNIFAGAGNDSIKNAAEGVNIDAGAGNDFVSLGADADSNQISLGAGNDTIIDSGTGGTTYFFGPNEGKNYILNFNGGTLQFNSSSSMEVTPSFTEEGVVFKFGTGTTVVIKGALKTGGTAGNPADYENLKPGEVSIPYGVKIGDNQIVPRNYNIEKIILGTETHDTGDASIANISDDSDGYTINAKAGNDSIFSNGDYVSINGGMGNDTIVLGKITGDKKTIVGANSGGTVYGGMGNDIIYSAGDNPKVFQYNYGDGNDTIYGFGSADILSINGGSYDYASVTSEGFEVRVGSYTVLLKGAMKEDRSALTANHALSAEYNEKLEGEPYIHIKDATHGDTMVKVENQVVGTNLAEELTNANPDYVIYAFNGDDKITNSGSFVTINAGAGSDSISLEGGDEVKVVPGQGNDSIYVKAGTDLAHLYEFELGDGENVIQGLGSKDTINIKGTNVSIKSAEFDDDYLVITLNDNRTKIKIKEIGASAYAKLGNAVKSFHLQINGVDQPEEFKVPNIIKVTISAETTFSGADNNGAIIEGNQFANNIKIDGANDISLAAGAGNDEISVKSGLRTTIAGGTGDDQISLSSAGHIIQYKVGDGNDTIYGWDDGDTLQLLGSTYEPTTVMTGKAFGLQYAGYTITFKKADGTDLAGDTAIKITGDVVNSTNDPDGYGYIEKTVPLLIQGTSGADSGDKALINDLGDNYVINAMAGNDSILNTYNGVNINADIGNDSVTSSGDNVTIYGYYGNDIISVGAGTYNSINAGDGADTIKLDSRVSESTIFGDTGNDLIFGNNAANTFVYNSGDGTDSIFGWNSNDSLKLGGDLRIGAKGVTLLDNGLRLYLTDNKYIFIKGALKDSGTAYNTADYDNLKKGDKITLLYSNNTSYVATVNAEKIVKRGVALENTDAEYLLTGSVITDTIYNNGGYGVTINGGKGDDVIKNTGDKASINGGEGNDVILLSNGSVGSSAVSVSDVAADTTVMGGAGDDTMFSNASGNGHVFKYNVNTDGSDVIYNFNRNDIIEFVGNFTTSNNPFNSVQMLNVKDGSGNDDPNKKDFVFKCNGGTITIKNVDVDVPIKYRFTYSNGTNTETIPKTVDVKREHRLETTEGNDNSHYYTNSNADYLITGTSRADYIKNEAENVTIDALGGENFISTTTVSYTTIYAGDSADTVINFASNALINIGNGANSIDNKATAVNTHITTGINADSITNAAGNVTITASDGENVIINVSTGDNTDIMTGKDNDTIQNLAGGVKIDAGAGNDSIDVNADKDVTVQAGLGDDTIFSGSAFSNTKRYIYRSGDGNDIISGWTSGDVIQFKLDAGDSYSVDETYKDGYKFNITNSSNVTTGSVIITSLVSDGNGGYTKQVLDGGKDVFVMDANENITCLSTPKIKYAVGSTEVTCSAEEHTLQGDNAGNLIVATGASSSIYGEGGGDTIYVGGDNSYVDGGADNDSITVSDGTKSGDPAAYTANGDYDFLTIKGGAGNDTITAQASHTKGIVYKYSAGNGSDTIVNYNAEDTINLDADASYTTSVSGSDFIIKMSDNNTIVLKDYNYDGSKSVNIYKGDLADTFDDTKFANIIVPYAATVTAGTAYTSNRNNAIITGTTGIDSITNTANTVEIKALAGDDKITVTSGSNVSVYAGAGNDTITNAESSHVPVTYVFGGGDGANVIENFDDSDIINYTDGTLTDSLVSSDENGTHLILTLGGTVVTLKGHGNTGNSAIIKDTSGTKYLNVGNILAGSDSAETLIADSSEREIKGYGGNDTILNNQTNDALHSNAPYEKVTMDGGAGNDIIENNGADAVIYGKEGNDSIKLLAGSSNTTVEGGAGIDTILNEDTSNGHVYQFAGDNAANTAVIRGFSVANDTIKITDSSEIAAPTNNSFSNGYFLLNIGRAVVSLQGNDVVGGATLKIIKSDGTDYNTPIIVPKVLSGSGTIEVTDKNNYYVFGSEGDDVITNSSSNVTISAMGGNDSITTTVDGVTIYGGGGYDSVKINVTGTRNNAIRYVLGYREGRDTVDGFDLAKDEIQLQEAPSAVTVNGAGDEIYIDDAYYFDPPHVTLKSVQNLTEGNVSIVAGGVTTKVPIKYRTVTSADTGAITNALSNITVQVSSGDHTINNTAAEVNIAAYAGTNTINNSGNSVTIAGGAGDDVVTVGGNNNSLNAGGGNDTITVSAGSSGTTIYGGAGNDTITNSATDGNFFAYSISDTGADTISTWVADKDVLWITNGTSSNITKEVASGNTTLTIGNNTVKLTGVNSGSIKVKYGGADVAEVELSAIVDTDPAAGPRVMEDAVEELTGIINDDNFISNDAQISDVTAVTSDNYSAGKIESIDFTSLAKNNYVPAASFSSKK